MAKYGFLLVVLKKVSKNHLMAPEKNHLLWIKAKATKPATRILSKKYFRSYKDNRTVWSVIKDNEPWNPSVQPLEFNRGGNN